MNTSLVATSVRKMNVCPRIPLAIGIKEIRGYADRGRMAPNYPDEIQSLRQKLENLLQEARVNEDKMRRFDLIERRLIGARSLRELIHLLLVEYKSAFAVEFVTLILVDPEHEAGRAIEAAQLDPEIADALTFIEAPDPLLALYKNHHRPCLAKFDPEVHQPLFDSPQDAISSVALLPLIRQGNLMGSFHFGSASPDRYLPGCGTDLLLRLAAIVALCIESTLNQERVKQAGLTDGLTGVKNRRYYENRLQEELAKAARHKHPLACMLLDVDKFKRINDTYGHQSGDEVLKSVAESIQAQLRPGDTVARYGGEEFIVLLPQTSDKNGMEIAERIRASIAGEMLRSKFGYNIHATLSIGLAVTRPDAMAGDLALAGHALVAAADKALYQAKQTGRNRVVRETPGSRQEAAPAKHDLGWRTFSELLGRPTRVAKLLGVKAATGYRDT